MIQKGELRITCENKAAIKASFVNCIQYLAAQPFCPFLTLNLRLSPGVDMKFTYYGHACFLVEAGGKNLLFDPFITPNELARNIKPEDIRADYILVTHGHGDHIADCVAIAQQNKATVIGPFEVVEWLNKQGVESIHPMNHGGKRSFDFGTVKCTNAIHSSSLPDGSYGGNPMGFIVSAGDRSFYYSGDTALTMDMQLVPRWGNIDFAILPIGDNFTMGYEDAIIAAELIQCRTIIGVHYDTFGYIRIDHQQVKKAFADAGLTLHLPQIGESIDL
jgi:L-ascorbate metabolism protein UlaG (beta-lactamase superfamily)